MLPTNNMAAIVLPEAAVYQILALNREKAHNLRKKALEVIRMYESRRSWMMRPWRPMRWSSTSGR